MSERPNILWYCTDQQRFDTIGALGNPHVRTPVIDQLVRDGVIYAYLLPKARFARQAGRASCPACTPAACTIRATATHLSQLAASDQ